MITLRIKNAIQAMLVCAMLLFTNNANGQTTDLKAGQQSPDFTVNDFYGNSIRLSSLKGKKVLLTFYRNVGCPVCNFRFHELQEQSNYFKEHGIQLLAVYESSLDKMKQYLNDETYYATMISDPQENLYGLYHIDKSTGKMMKGMFHGAMGKMKKGKKLYKTKIEQDGNSNRIGADFLIDEQGLILNAHYGKYVGDHLSMEEIKGLIN